MRTIVVAVAVLAMAAFPLAAAEADPVELHKLAKQAHIQAQIQVGPNDPDSVHDLLEVAEVHMEAILNSTDAKTAGESFLAAMLNISDAFVLMNQNVVESDDDRLHYTAVLERQIRYYGQLRELAISYEVEYDGKEMDTLLTRAAAQIDAGDAGVTDTLASINDMTGQLREQIGAVAAQEDIDRGREYAALYITHLDRLVADADELNIPPEGVNLMLAIRDRLVAATDPSDIISIINAIIMLQDALDLAKTNQLELWMQDTEDAVEQMRLNGILDDIEYAAVEATLGRFQEEMDAGNLDEANTILTRLNNWLTDQ